MQLKDFVAYSLTQIMEGILEAQQTATGGQISPKLELSSVGSARSADAQQRRGDPVEYVTVHDKITWSIADRPGLLVPQEPARVNSGPGSGAQACPED